MYQVIKREQYGPVTFLWEVVAPEVARACQPGHFIMLRIDETGERLPEDAPNEAPKDLRPGESVEIVKTGTRATVLIPPDDRGEDARDHRHRQQHQPRRGRGQPLDPLEVEHQRDHRAGGDEPHRRHTEVADREVAVPEQS